MAKKASRKSTRGKTSTRRAPRKREAAASRGSSTRGRASAKAARSKRASPKRTRTAQPKRTRTAQPKRTRAVSPKAAKRANADVSRRAPSLERARKQLVDVEDTLPSPPSSLNMERRGTAVRSGRAALNHAKHEHTETSPAMTGGDVDADWEDAYAVGDEAPGGDNPTPDQDRVDDIGRALGVQYQDNEELKPEKKIADRDRHRWELDPASSEDYKDRDGK